MDLLLEYERAVEALTLARMHRAPREVVNERAGRVAELRLQLRSALARPEAMRAECDSPIDELLHRAESL